MKKLLLVILSLSVLVSQFDIASAMKREFNQEQEEEKPNKKIKTQTTLKKLSKDEILHIFKFLNGRSVENFMQVEKRFYNIFDDVKNPSAILSFSLVDELGDMNLDDKTTKIIHVKKIIQVNKKFLNVLIKNIDAQDANNILIWATGNIDIHLVRMLLENTDFLNLINRRGANDSIGWASENGDADIVETLLTNSTIAGLVNYGVRNGMNWAIKNHQDLITENLREHYAAVVLVLITFAPNSCSHDINDIIVNFEAKSNQDRITLIVDNFTINTASAFEYLARAIFILAAKQNTIDYIQKLLNNRTIINGINAETAKTAYENIKNDKIRELLENNEHIKELLK